MLRACCLCLFTAVVPAQSVLLHHGKVWTGDAGNPTATAVVVQGDRIVYVGDDATAARRAGDGARVVDLHGHSLLPGIIDAHVHCLDGGNELLAPDLRSATSAEQMAQRLAAFAATLPKGSWIESGNWDHQNWPGAALPTAADLDRHVRDHPVFVTRLDGHMAVANSLAMRIAGIGADTPDPPGGSIVRDAAGAPAGVFKDAAMALVRVRIPAWNQEQRLQRARLALQHAASLGVTSMHDMLYSFAAFDTWQQLRQRGELTCRITVYTPIADIGKWGAVRVRRGFGDDWLRLNGCKAFADGSLGSSTAWFDLPYDDAPQTSGLPMPELTDGAMQEALSQCAHLGLQPAVHAIGDRANATVLDLFAATAGLRALRPRIEHAQHLRAGDIARFADLGVVASMQPYHAIDDGRWAEARIGSARCKTTYAFRSLLEAGAVLAFGSDWPVAPLSPWLGIHAAVSRSTLDGAHPDGWVPEQKLTLQQALTAYTRGGAFAGFAEDRLGVLRAGYLADLVVLDRDLAATPVAQLRDVQVVSTMVGGRTVFERR